LRTPSQSFAKDSLVGSLLAGHYEIGAILGQGGMSVVYKAYDVLLKRTVAIKVLRASEGLEASKVMRLQQEGQAAGRLDHPGIVRIHEIKVSPDGAPYLVMDFVEGETLAEAIQRKGQLPVEQALTIFIQVANALVHAHAKGVLHRDLKPSNIMLVANGQEPTVKVLDFGVAKILENADGTFQSLTKTGDVFGSPLYMSPEQGIGAKVDHRSDIYSLGCSLYEALTAVAPYVGPTAVATMLMHQNNKPLPLSEASLGGEFPHELQNIVSKMLAKNPDERFQSMQEVEDALVQVKNALHQKDSKQRSPKTWEVLAKVRFPLEWIAAVLFVAVLVVFSLTYRGRLPAHWFADNRASDPRIAAPLSSAARANLEARAAQCFRDANRYFADHLPERARTPLLEAMSIYQQLDADGPAYLTCANALAADYMRTGNYVESEALFNRVLKIEENRSGLKSEAAARACRNLGAVKLLQGRYDAADRLYKSALDIFVAAQGPEGAEVVTTYQMLGNRHRVTKNFAKAEEFLQKALRISRKTQGVNSPSYLDSVNGLAMSYFEQGNLVQSEKYATEAVRLREQTPDADSARLAEALRILGDILDTDGKYLNALETHERALYLYKSLCGSQSPEAYYEQTRMCNDLVKLGRINDARRYANSTRELAKVVFGHNSLEEASCLEQLMQLNMELRDTRQAEMCCRELQSIYIKLHKEDEARKTEDTLVEILKARTASVKITDKEKKAKLAEYKRHQKALVELGNDMAEDEKNRP
jgi:serine/threonine protein kinase